MSLSLSRHRSALALVSVLTLAFGAGCSSKASTPASTPGSQSIGATGGTLTLADGTEVVIPAGALATAQTITITSTADVPAGYVGESPLYQFGPSGLQFSKPVQVTLPFHAGATSPAIYWSSASGVGYDELGGTASATTITASVMHFSSGFVAEAGGPADGGADATAGAAGGTAGATGGTAGGIAGAGGGTAGAAGGAAGATGGGSGGGGSGQDGGATSDASSDAVVTPDAGGGSDGGVVTCGAAPLDPITFNFDATMSFKGTGTFMSSGCVGKSIPWSSGTGPFLTNFTDGVAVWVRMDPVSRAGDPATLPIYFPELKPIAAFGQPVGGLLWDVTSVATVKAMVPSFDQATMSLVTVATALNKTGTVAPCNANDGVTYAVSGHAEAVVIYAGASGALSNGTSTSTDGTAYITLLPTSALEYITVVGTKAGCTVRNAGYIYTGRVPVAPGTTSTAVGF